MRHLILLFLLVGQLALGAGTASATAASDSCIASIAIQASHGPLAEAFANTDLLGPMPTNGEPVTIVDHLASRSIQGVIPIQPNSIDWDTAMMATYPVLRQGTSRLDGQPLTQGDSTLTTLSGHTDHWVFWNPHMINSHVASRAWKRIVHMIVNGMPRYKNQPLLSSTLIYAGLTDYLLDQNVQPPTRKARTYLTSRLIPSPPSLQHFRETSFFGGGAMGEVEDKMLVPRQISFSVCSWGFPTEDHPGIGKNLFDRALDAMAAYLEQLKIQIEGQVDPVQYLQDHRFAVLKSWGCPIEKTTDTSSFNWKLPEYLQTTTGMRQAFLSFSPPLDTQTFSKGMPYMWLNVEGYGHLEEGPFQGFNLLEQHFSNDILQVARFGGERVAVAIVLPQQLKSDLLIYIQAFQEALTAFRQNGTP